MTVATGMSRTLADGRFSILPWRDHLSQSIEDILTTPIGTRTMRLEYGSKVPRLVDRPVNQAWKLEVYVAVTEAIHRWEPRVRVKQVHVLSAGMGYVEIGIDCVRTDNNERVELFVKVSRDEQD